MHPASTPRAVYWPSPQTIHVQLTALRLIALVRSSCDPQAASTSVAERAEAAAAAPAEDGSAAEIYIGFPKGDYASREGRKGRVIKDDPTKYPAKEDLGPLLGATGGIVQQLLLCTAFLAAMQQRLLFVPCVEQ